MTAEQAKRIVFRDQRLTWAEGVARMRVYDLERGANAWNMGDLALAMIPLGDDRSHNGAKQKLLDLAEEVGTEARLLEVRRFVASKVPDVIRMTSVSWSAYREVVEAALSEEERLALFERFKTRADTISGRWTVNAVRPLIGRKPVIHTGSEPLVEHLKGATPEEIEEAAEEAADDPQSPLAQTLDALADAHLNKVVQKAMEEEGKQRDDEGPTVSAADLHDKIKEAKASSVFYQYTRLAVHLSGFIALCPKPEQLAEAILGDESAGDPDRYLDTMARNAAYFQAVRDALVAGRRPRLVPVGREAAS